MQFDLVSAYSAKIYWDASLSPEVIEFSNENGFYEAAKCESDDLSTVIVNLDASTTYNVKLTTPTSVVKSTVTTCSEEEPALENLYESLKVGDKYDTTRLNKYVHDVFLANFSKIVNQGDDIIATVGVNGVQKQVLTKAVVDGGSYTVDGNNLFMPFSKDSGKMMQVVTLVDSEEANLTYSPETDMFSYAGEEYGIGDKFEMMGRMVTVADGSIVLVFADTVAKTWGFSSASALNTVGSAGSSFHKNVTANVVNLMSSKADGETAETYMSAWAHNTTDSTTEEMTRIISSVDADTENATISFGVRHLDASGNTYIEPTIQSTYGSTTISAQDATDATRSATFNSTGLIFDTDDAAIYFGASQDFRLQYTEGTPSLLKIQAYDSVSGDYVTKQEFSNSTV